MNICRTGYQSARMSRMQLSHTGEDETSPETRSSDTMRIADIGLLSP